MKDNLPIVRNKKTNDLYKYLGNNEYINLRTKQQGLIDESIANKVFNINLDATVLLNEYPEIQKLISKLNLKIKNND